MGRIRYLKTIILVLLLLQLPYSTSDALFPKISHSEKTRVQHQKITQYINDLSHSLNEAYYYLKFRINQNKLLRQPFHLAMTIEINDDRQTQDGFNQLNQLFANKNTSPNTSQDLLTALAQYANQCHVSVFFFIKNKNTHWQPTLTQQRRALPPPYAVSFNVSNLDKNFLHNLDEIHQHYDIVLNITDSTKDENKLQQLVDMNLIIPHQPNLRIVG